jgi:phenylacetate-CoA ligase
MTVITEARADHWDGAGMRDEAQRLADSIKNTIGVTSRVVIQAPGTIERSTGKAKRVIDRR